MKLSAIKHHMVAKWGSASNKPAEDIKLKLREWFIYLKGFPMYTGICPRSCLCTGT